MGRLAPGLFIKHGEKGKKPNKPAEPEQKETILLSIIGYDS